MRKKTPTALDIWRDERAAEDRARNLAATVHVLTEENSRLLIDNQELKARLDSIRTELAQERLGRLQSPPEPETPPISQSGTSLPPFNGYTSPPTT